MLEMQSTMDTGIHYSGSTRPDVSELIHLAAKGLKQMLDPQSQLFCYKLKKTANGLLREEISHRYSMMTLLGLHRLEAAGQPSPVEIKPVLEALLRDTSWITGAGDLGLLLWTCAETAPDRLPEVCGRVHLTGALRRYSDARCGYTMEVAWFLAGVAHCLLAGYDDPELSHEGLTAFQLLKSNCGTGGIFGHVAKDRSIAGRLRGRIGSFADQVYPIYALAMFARAYNNENEEAKRIALRTAQTICQLQGPLGQWWWHYDSSTGRVVGHYPVYSVHQHAMGPMALFALGEVTQQDFSKPIFAGLDWVAGDNELNLDMRDGSQHVIWRSFYQNQYEKYSNEILGLAGLPSSPKGLRVKYECRPYELGWLLYAFAEFANNISE